MKELVIGEGNKIWIIISHIEDYWFLRIYYIVLDISIKSSSILDNVQFTSKCHKENYL